MRSKPTIAPSRRLLNLAVLGLGLLVSATQAGAQSECAGNTSFLVGSGIYDITGPAAEVGMMGYGSLGQQTAGIHQRLRARAFVIASPCNGKRVAFVSADLGMVFQSVKQQVVEQLQKRYAGVYSDANVMLSATHTHAGPGGFSHYALYNITSLGYNKQNFDAIVDGIVQSIERAHKNLAPGSILVNAGDLRGASGNRSTKSYGANPPPEVSQYGSENTDTRMTLLRLQGADGTEVGSINWFAVHNTSLGNTNRLISGDNKGYASYLFERAKGANYLAPKTFVAAFAQSNEGDVTPNLHPPPDRRGGNEVEAMKQAGGKQYDMAKSLYESAKQPLTGAVDYRHTYVKMDAVQVESRWTGTTPGRTCTAAIGISMPAGAEDGPGVGAEGLTCGDAQKLVKAFVCPAVTNACQAEKPIVLQMGSMTPYPWTPEVLPLQVVTFGNLAIVAVPFEVTTMAGRRLRRTILDQLSPIGVNQVVIAGLANAYAGYVSTHQEYAVQEYEGASTQFGPWTLGAVQQETAKLAFALRSGTPVAPGPTPRDLRNYQTALQPGVVFDDKPVLLAFGAVKADADQSYRRGQMVSVKFWGGHPKNNLRRQNSFLQVQRKAGTSWVTVAYDWDWDTKYRWERISDCVGCSHVTIEWQIQDDATPGTYRIRHDGDWKSGITGAIKPYTGYSREFTVQ